ncbi:MAG: thiamine phosphate synthase [Alphaproteobacteria bacterium]|nr:MAG: thiamine phosphate synthase [Alphaproteobacteria bacterium]
MQAPDGPQIYLLTPPAFDPDVFAGELAVLLDAPAGPAPVACLRLDMPGAGEEAIRRAADALREVAHARDIALLIADHYRLVPEHGLDGVHLSDGHRQYRAARKLIGRDGIVGCHCGSSRHAAMTAAEMGADYVALGPFAVTGALGPDECADPELAEWWGATVETPLVVEGGLSGALLERLVAAADFIALGPEIWAAPEGAPAALAAIRERLDRVAG